MFKDISWAMYGIFTAIVLAVYYLIIAILYYIYEIKQLFSGKSNFILKLPGAQKFVKSSSNSITQFAENETL